METKEFLKKMGTKKHVSGHEGELVKLLQEEFSKYAEVKSDRFGNLIAHRTGTGAGKGPKIMLAAHMDEIGLMVTDITETGFVKFTRVGGVAARTILAQEVTIHGLNQDVYGVIGLKPPHLCSPQEQKKIVELHDMAIDTGYTEEKLKKLIRPGDVISLNQEIVELQNGKVSGRALDDTAGLAVLLCTMQNLEHYNHEADVYYVASAQEEVGLRGAITSAYNIKPDIGIAVDVTDGRGGGAPEIESYELGKGPAIAVGPNVNRQLFEALKKSAVGNNISYQIEVIERASATDAAAIQINEGGCITGLVSIPLNYMHSTVETASLADIENCGRLLAAYIMSLQGWEGHKSCC